MPGKFFVLNCKIQQYLECSKYAYFRNKTKQSGNYIGASKLQSLKSNENASLINES